MPKPLVTLLLCALHGTLINEVLRAGLGLQVLVGLFRYTGRTLGSLRKSRFTVIVAGATLVAFWSLKVGGGHDEIVLLCHFTFSLNSVRLNPVGPKRIRTVSQIVQPRYPIVLKSRIIVLDF